MRKALVTLNIGNYQPAIRALTFPLMKLYADKIHADFIEITERRFPEFPIVYEKLQCRDIGKQLGYEWVMFFDADALINPEMFDPTSLIPKDTVLFNGKDMSRIRFYADEYFLRDGRSIGACNWFACASDWCFDLWNPLDIPFEEAVSSISVTVQEHNSGQFHDNHLIDDYTLSRNIARYGLKHTTMMDICGGLGIRDQFGRGVSPHLWHVYSMTEEEKLSKMLQLLSTPLNQAVDPGAPRPWSGWQLMTAGEVIEFKKQWGLK